jgi:zinc transporter 1
MNVNMYAMLIHYAGDMVSSLLVLVAGIILYYEPTQTWAAYIDPISSVIIVIIIIYTTVPLLIRCSKILLQRVPQEIELGTIRTELLRVNGVIGVHELHVWPLVDEMVIASVHISCEEGGDFNSIAESFKRIFHTHGIHSTTIQPEFVPRNSPADDVCKQNCVEDCGEPWCCKPNEDQKKRVPLESQSLPNL